MPLATPSRNWSSPSCHIRSWRCRRVDPRPHIAAQRGRRACERSAKIRPVTGDVRPVTAWRTSASQCLISHAANVGKVSTPDVKGAVRLREVARTVGFQGGAALEDAAGVCPP